jgi:carboxymethylenebutenolidase
MALGRRGFLTASLAAGFAAAARPVMAQAIHTDSEGLVADEIRIPVAGGMMPGYHAYPASGGNFPIVVVIQEIFGVHEHIRDVVRRLAKQGYYAIAAELYARQGDVSKYSEIKDIIQNVVSKVPDDQVMSDLDSVVDFARSLGKADLSRLGVTGFCWGGRATWLYAAHNPKVRAAVAWYGLLAEPMWDKKATSVFAQLPKVKVPVLAYFGEKDSFIPQTDVEKLRAAIKGTASQAKVYPGVEHGFNADYRPSYNAEAAKDAWAGMLAWFKANGV